MSIEYSKEEYLDVSANLRHYGSARFALLTLFLAIVAGLLTAVYGGQIQPGEVVITIWKIGGALISLAFLVMEERTSCYYRRFRERAIELEKALGFKQYRNCPKQKGITSTNAVRVVYGLTAFFWLISLLI